jgi:tRNA nucleotidyltransferase/poly(A) polymerase
LGFSLEASTQEAIVARAKLIAKISAERVRDELTLMWMGPQPSEALSLLSEFKLLSIILPELEALKGVIQVPASHKEENLWQHTLKMVQTLVTQGPVRSPNLLWAAILHEVGKPIALKINLGKNFNGHEIEAVKQVQLITQRFKMSRADCDRIAILVAEHTKFKEVFQMRESTLQRLVRAPHFEELLALHKADATSSDGNLAYYEFCASRLEAFKQSSEPISFKLIDGTDLIQLGFQPGPEFSEILNVLEDLALEKKLKSKEEALEYVLKNFVH